MEEAYPLGMYMVRSLKIIKLHLMELVLMSFLGIMLNGKIRFLLRK